MIERLKNIIINFLRQRSPSRLLLYFLAFNVLLLVVSLVLIPMQTASLEKEALTSRQQVGQKRSILKSLERVDVIESRCDTYRRQFLERENLPLLLKDLAVLAEGQKVEIVSVDYKHLPERRENLQELSMTMIVRGPYSQLRRFLHLVKQYKIPLVIQELAISTSKREKTDDKIELKIGMVTYFR
jgi:hypothetical protein